MPKDDPRDFRAPPQIAPSLAAIIGNDKMQQAVATDRLKRRDDGSVVSGSPHSAPPAGDDARVCQNCVWCRTLQAGNDPSIVCVNEPPRLDSRGISCYPEITAPFTCSRFRHIKDA